MSILVDKRVGSIELLEPIAKRVNCEVRAAMLNSADAAFTGNGPGGEVSIGIERKTIGDALNSIRSGRLAGDQIIKMSDDYDFAYVIVEGIFRPNDEGILETWSRGGWGPLNYGRGGFYYYAELDKFLDSLELQRNVMVKRSTTRIETVWQIVNLYHYFQKDWTAHHSMEAIKTQVGNVFRKASVLRMVAAQLPGIGWERSKAVEKKFGTIERMISALPTEWQEVDGIGKVTALKVCSAIRGTNGS